MLDRHWLESARLRLEQLTRVLLLMLCCANHSALQITRTSGDTAAVTVTSIILTCSQQSFRLEAYFAHNSECREDVLYRISSDTTFFSSSCAS